MMGGHAPVSAPVTQVTNKPPLEVVEKMKPGTIHNPYTGKPDMIAEGVHYLPSDPAADVAAGGRKRAEKCTECLQESVRAI